MDISRDICTDLDQSLHREWLVTNGLGGYAMGTVAGAGTRRYHNLLVAATKPPVERTVLLSRIDETVTSGARVAELATNLWISGAISPRGYTLLRSFRLEESIPVWTFELDGITLEKRVWMVAGSNTTCVRYTLVRGPDATLLLRFLVNRRGHHAVSREGAFDVEHASMAHGLRLALHPHQLFLCSDRGSWRPQYAWHLGYFLPVECDRGYEHVEDLLSAATCESALKSGQSVTIVASTDEPGIVDGDGMLDVEHRRAQGILQLGKNVRSRRRAQAKAPTKEKPEFDEIADRLTLAADQFIVRRGDGATVIAGYPWFADWGRDTMISFAGLFLATGRVEEGASVLRTFAANIRDGLVPNRFADDSGEPEYNTADASLWFVQAVDSHRRATGDLALVRELLPAMAEILEHHRRGTCFGIGVDPSDGLLRCGDQGWQLTWMDARIGDWVVTPRRGKPVEINALWHSALRTMAGFRHLLSESPASLLAEAELARESFARFWNESAQGLYDVIDSPEHIGGNDDSIRPNQLFAVSLPHSPLSVPRQRAVIDLCRRELLVPRGLRTLSPRDPRYVGDYRGDQRTRDSAYHQGTVWPWLLGALVDSYRNAYGQSAFSRGILNGILQHLPEAGVGSISEVFDGDPPHGPGGCPFQAWSVAEVLRLL
jgi:predicted glycogen debranching enzyme